MTEYWKDIPGFEGRYQVSNLGRVRSLDRIVTQRNRYGATMHRRVKGAVLTPTDNGSGYKIVGLSKRRGGGNHYVHRLVAEAFCPRGPQSEVVDHIDRDRSNNRADNLVWCTQQENVVRAVPHMKHPKSNARRPASTGEKYISVYKGRYRLQITRDVDGRRTTVVSRQFKTLEEAVVARGVFLSV